eukprot:gene4495-32570_t
MSTISSARSCGICKITCTSEEWRDHFNGKEHKAALAEARDRRASRGGSAASTASISPFEEEMNENAGTSVTTTTSFNNPVSKPTLTDLRGLIRARKAATVTEPPQRRSSPPRRDDYAAEDNVLPNALVQFLQKAGGQMKLSDLFDKFFRRHPGLKKFKPCKATAFIQAHSGRFEMKTLGDGQHQISLSVASRAVGDKKKTLGDGQHQTSLSVASRAVGDTKKTLGDGQHQTSLSVASRAVGDTKKTLGDGHHQTSLSVASHAVDDNAGAAAALAAWIITQGGQ